MDTRKPYPSDVSGEEWEFVTPYLTLLPMDVEQLRDDLREVFNAMRWLVSSGAHRRMLPHELPPWAVVYQQTQRWFKASCFTCPFLLRQEQP
jgi:transposase